MDHPPHHSARCTSNTARCRRSPSMRRPRYRELPPPPLVQPGWRPNPPSAEQPRSFQPHLHHPVGHHHHHHVGHHHHGGGAAGGAQASSRVAGTSGVRVAWEPTVGTLLNAANPVQAAFPHAPSFVFDLAQVPVTLASAVPAQPFAVCSTSNSMASGGGPLGATGAAGGAAGAPHYHLPLFTPSFFAAPLLAASGHHHHVAPCGCCFHHHQFAAPAFLHPTHQMMAATPLATHQRGPPQHATLLPQPQEPDLDLLTEQRRNGGAYGSLSPQISHHPAPGTHSPSPPISHLLPDTVTTMPSQSDFICMVHPRRLVHGRRSSGRRWRSPLIAATPPPPPHPGFLLHLFWWPYDGSSAMLSNNPMPAYTPEIANAESPAAENYEALLSLAERLGEAKPRGLPRAEIEQLLSYRFNPETHESEQTSCVVCMCDFEARQVLRVLPCAHEFHARCVDKWLKNNRTCPICRGDASEGGQSSE